MIKKYIIKQKADSKGFTLVELLVASAVVSIAILSVIAFIRKGEDLAMLDRHRRAAHGIVERTLESIQYLPSNYNNLQTGVKVTNNVVIDESVKLLGTLRDSVSSEMVNSFNGYNIPYRKVIATVIWKEDDTVSVRSEKWVTLAP